MYLYFSRLVLDLFNLLFSHLSYLDVLMIPTFIILLLNVYALTFVIIALVRYNATKLTQSASFS